MMKGAGHVNAGFPRHEKSRSEITSLGNLFFGDASHPLILKDFGRIFILLEPHFQSIAPLCIGLIKF